MDKSKLFYIVSGTAMMLSSAVTFADYKERKKKAEKTSHKSELVAGLIGGAVGMYLATRPVKEEHEKKKPVDKTELFEDEENAKRADSDIREVLNEGRADHPRKTGASVRAIEVDEDTSIDDFI